MSTAAICWTEDLRVGNHAIDEDHRHLFALLDNLRHTMPTGLVTQQAAVIIDDLAAYVESHFQREEEFMIRIAYADYPRHKAEHDRFVSEVHALQSRLARGAQTVTLSIDQVLSEWLRRHVLVMDMALAESLKARL
jgi:hemerythrin